MEQKGYRKLSSPKNSTDYSDRHVAAPQVIVAQQQNWQQCQEVHVALPFQGDPYRREWAVPPAHENLQYQPAANYIQQHHQVQAHYAKQAELQLPHNSIYIRCPRCNKPDNSRVEFQTGGCTLCAGFILFAVTGILCCWVPYVVDECKDAIHYCPHCNYELGSNKQC